ncbi:hypothetical protein K490DRAFT_64168 [Saccharata proteae CBS 121410]|uniref:Uncharacterized protein n=1 Tax=Saccharata proteae CBS 121410 TaxID=1314787 RepID=A0A6A5YAR7_9PEZI|nr:hypothetical protein K490DRAFT_64168 [Saccharata proteae CBS 121410]
MFQRQEDTVPSIINDWIPKLSHYATVKQERESIIKRIEARFGMLEDSRRLSELNSKWPKVESAYKEGKKDFKERVLYQWINLEDLSKDRPLLLMLNSRGRHHPQHFFGVDYRKVFIAQNWSIIDIEEEDEVLEKDLRDYKGLMFYTKGTTAEEYGKIEGASHISADNEEDLKSRLKAYERNAQLDHDAKKPQEGLETLKMQLRILQFLLKCCNELLSQKRKRLNLKPADLLDEARFPILPEPEEASESNKDFATIVAETLYRKPEGPDFDRLEHSLVAKVLEAEDHMWLLHEMPGHFKETLEGMEGQDVQGVILDARGSVGTHSRARHDSLVHRLVCDGYERVARWKNLRLLVDRVRKTKAKYVGDLVPGQDMPKEYMQQLQQLYNHLTYSFEPFAREVRYAIATLPQIRGAYVRDDSEEIEHGRPKIRPVNEFRSRFRKGSACPDLIVYNELLVDSDVSNIYEPHARVRFLLDIINNSKGNEISYLFTSHAMVQLADLSLLADVMRGIDNYYPWATKIRLLKQEADEGNFGKAGEDGADTRERAPRMTHEAGRYMCDNKHTGIGGLARLVVPLSKFAFPAEEWGTKKWTERMRNAEKYLDEFWEDADRHANANDEQGVIDGIWGHRLIERTPEWVDQPEIEDLKMEDAVPQPKERKSKTIRKIIERVVKSKGQSEADPGVTKTGIIETKIERKRPAEGDGESRTKKVKTRNPPREEAPEPEAPIPPPSPKFYKVNSRIYDVMRMLFHMPKQRDLPGGLKWTEFEYAMKSLGFKVQQQASSATELTPPTDNPTLFARKEPPGAEILALTVHRPHGREQYWQLWKARETGRRFRAQWGWTADFWIEK